MLIVVDDVCTAPHLCASVRAFAAGRTIEALVVAPAHDAAFAQWYVDEDAVRAEATHRLRTCLSCLSRDGIQATGHLCDADPVQGISDALYNFGADEILLVTAAMQPSNWLRPSIVDRVRRTFAHPVYHVTMPETRSAVAIEPTSDSASETPAGTSAVTGHGTSASSSAVYECAMCRAPVTRTEKNGMAYCDTHWRAVHPERIRRLLRVIRGTGSPAGNPRRFGHRATS